MHRCRREAEWWTDRRASWAERRAAKRRYLSVHFLVQYLQPHPHLCGREFVAPWCTSPAVRSSVACSLSPLFGTWVQELAVRGLLHARLSACLSACLPACLSATSFGEEDDVEPHRSTMCLQVGMTGSTTATIGWLVGWLVRFTSHRSWLLRESDPCAKQ
ncbi:hypothetical protein IWX47DRAFT_882289 [Phyllosticta citricarpa]